MTNTQSALLLVAVLLALLVLWPLSRWAVFAGGRLIRRAARHLPHSRAWTETHPLRAALAARFPRSHAFLARRLDPRRFTGLPLTLLAIAALYVGSLIGGLVEEVLEAEEMIDFDNRANAWFAPYRTPLLIEIFAWITDLGGSSALVALIVAASGLLWAGARPGLILPLWITFLGSQATTWLGKFAFARERPEFLTAITASYPSFPSGHATGAMAVYGFLAYAIARDLPIRRQRYDIAYWTLILVLMIGFSRVFLSVHYVSDVATGFLVGGFWLLVGFTLAEYRRTQANRPA